MAKSINVSFRPRVHLEFNMVSHFEKVPPLRRSMDNWKQKQLEQLGSDDVVKEWVQSRVDATNLAARSAWGVWDLVDSMDQTG